MTKPRRPATRKSADGPAEDGKKKRRKSDGTRETIESIVVAFILAFLFRTFEAEAFVIPTGSMAPTLLGRHKDVTCPQCGYHYTVGASDEVTEDGYMAPESHLRDKYQRVDTAFCPNCRFETRIYDFPAFKGDRILVNKWPYEFGEPERWDVIVFKYPEEPKTNYIKRLVGLPGETLEIRQGDVYVQTEKGWRILRKEDPYKQRELQILVYDNDRPARALLEAGWPERWTPAREDRTSSVGWAGADDGFAADYQSRTFTLPGEAAQDDRLHWIRYQHFVPGPEDWEAAQEEKIDPPLARLILDFCGYNAYTGGAQQNGRPEMGRYWVGDLTLSCEVDIGEAEKDAQIVLELVESRFYRCRIDVQTGRATLVRQVAQQQPLDEPEEQIIATGQTEVLAGGRYRLTFANVDNRLCLWVNDRLIEFDGPTEYEASQDVPYQIPTDRDLSPAGIAARGCMVTVSGLLLERDIYYRSEVIDPDDQYIPKEDFTRLPSSIPEANGNGALAALAHNPDQWWNQYWNNLSTPPRFRIGPDEFFMLGDNSPRSQDSRLWRNTRRAERRHAVPREALVGKAFFIYWPHGIPFLNDGRGFSVRYHKTPDGRIYREENPRTGEVEGYPSFRVPFYPNVGRMQRIR